MIDEARGCSVFSDSQKAQHSTSSSPPQQQLLLVLVGAGGSVLVWALGEVDGARDMLWDTPKPLLLYTLLAACCLSI